MLMHHAAFFTAVLAIGACSHTVPQGDELDADVPAAETDAAAPSIVDASPPSADAATVPPVGVDAAPEPMACGEAELAPGDDENIEIDSGGVRRLYNIHVGDAVEPSQPAPLVLNFHGMNNSPAIQESFSGMKRLADEQGFVVVYPAGLNASFNAGGCCGSSSQQGVDDMGFSLDIVADVSARLCIDEKRVYATGFSNGGYMSHRLACEASDVFAAIAPVAGAMAIRSCAPGRAVPVMTFHGDADFVVSYSSAVSAVNGWVARNGCADTSEHEEYGRSGCEIWRDCDGDTEVQLCTIAGWSHLWPNGYTAIPASPRIWEFFTRHRLP